ncbi:hypothetical protein [Pseudomonas syringae]|uniref:hypothetical protein n=1 Tax=Pseudomonas syringae TaxID=317 RepID=UPI0012AECE68|nr:hypothetical protein [Pseudomonas syringae]
MKRFLGTHALLICVLVFPLLPAIFIGGALMTFGTQGLAWICGIVGIGLPLAGLALIKRYLKVGPNVHS